MSKEFDKFDEQNPIVWKLFQKYTKEFVMAKLNCGVPRHKIKLSAWLVVARIRWETQISTDDEFSSFKINNNYTAHYSRKFIERFPKWEHLFETRELKIS